MKNIILSTDWWTDCDDAVAIRLLANAHKNGKINLLGICIDGCMEYSVQSLSAYMTDMLLGDIPIGLDRAATDFQGRGNFQKMLCEYPSVLKNNDEAENAVSFYRKLLAQSDGKVDIIEIGFMQILAALLESEPDEYSVLNGMELVSQKVDTLYAMAGKWDADGGKEHNFCNNHRSINGGIKVCDKWPTNIVFLGFEVGEPVISGSKLDKSDLLYKILEVHGSKNGRCSWDPMTVLLALDGFEGYSTVRGVASLDENGANHFVNSENGKHVYVVKTQPDEYYATKIDGRL